MATLWHNTPISRMAQFSLPPAAGGCRCQDYNTPQHLDHVYFNLFCFTWLQNCQQYFQGKVLWVCCVCWKDVISGNWDMLQRDQWLHSYATPLRREKEHWPTCYNSMSFSRSHTLQQSHSLRANTINIFAFLGALFSIVPSARFLEAETLSGQEFASPLYCTHTHMNIKVALLSIFTVTCTTELSASSFWENLGGIGLQGTVLRIACPFQTLQLMCYVLKSWSDSYVFQQCL